MTDDDVRSFRDRDRSLRVLSQREARYAQHRGLLLHAAGVRQHERRVRFEGDEVQVAHRSDDLQPLEVELAQPGLEPRVGG
jgi:hypothetical protein